MTPQPPGFFVAWFRPSEFSSWQRTATVTSAPEAFRRLAALGRIGTGAQHFVTRGQTPDAVFDRIDAMRRRQAA